MANYKTNNPTTALAERRGNALEKDEKERFSEYIGKPDIRVWLNNVLGDQGAAQNFVANVTSAIATSPKLAECTPATVVSSALLANALKLSLSTSLGHCYLVPFKDNKNKRTVATFVLGYKGIIQLAIRSGQYKNINVVEIRQGELKRWDSFTEEIELTRIEDDTVREQTPVIGYYAYFRLINGFIKQMYWSKEKMQIHADKYSKAYSLADDERLRAGKIPADELWKYSSYWYSDFDGMAFKTMLRQLIGKWGVMSTDLQKAFEEDDKADAKEYFSADGQPSPTTSQQAVSEDDEEFSLFADEDGEIISGEQAPTAE